MFFPLTRDTQQAAQFEKSSPYEEVISSLIRHMINETVPQGYQITPVTISAKRKQADSTPREATLTPTLIYLGEALTGTVYTVTNYLPPTPSRYTPRFFISKALRHSLFHHPRCAPTAAW
ncbi:hypothetical protein [Photobacterium leiognathi]|uniref:hypothetical protein n=1 Tax=Photobacterium leiognathi TaxID=553611 RepID=UPI003F751949